MFLHFWFLFKYRAVCVIMFLCQALSQVSILNIQTKQNTSEQLTWSAYISIQWRRHSDICIYDYLSFPITPIPSSDICLGANNEEYIDDCFSIRRCSLYWYICRPVYVNFLIKSSSILIPYENLVLFERQYFWKLCCLLTLFDTCECRLYLPTTTFTFTVSSSPPVLYRLCVFR